MSYQQNPVPWFVEEAPNTVSNKVRAIEIAVNQILCEEYDTENQYSTVKDMQDKRGEK